MDRKGAIFLEADVEVAMVGRPGGSFSGGSFRSGLRGKMAKYCEFVAV